MVLVHTIFTLELRTYLPKRLWQRLLSEQRRTNGLNINGNYTLLYVLTIKYNMYYNKYYALLRYYWNVHVNVKFWAGVETSIDAEEYFM